MSVGQAMRDRALTLSALTALIGQRVFMLKAPQNERRSYVVFQPQAPIVEQHLKGPTYPAYLRLQTDVYVTESESADAFDEAETIGAAVFGDGMGPDATGLFGFVGDIGGSPATYHIHNVELALARGPMYEVDGTVRKVRIQQDFRVKWSPL